MTKEDVISLYNKYVVGSYTRDEVVFVRGKGSRIEDIDGKKYLDFFPGWAVSGLGHCPAEVVKALKIQAGTLMHVSNNFYHPQQARYAEALSAASFGGKVFFGNSGAEANEAAIKLCRLYGREKGRYKIVSMENSFHGRSLATVTMTGQPKYNEPFKPLPEGFLSVPFNDIDAVAGAVDDKTVAVILELIQGEGGINVADAGYVAKLVQLAKEKDLLIVVDEVQTGFGRTGKLFAYQHYDFIPDIITLAKTIGGGFPFGVMVARPVLADLMVPGTHASTFGGGPLACACGLAVLETIEKKKLLDKAVRQGKYLRRKLDALKKKYPAILQVKGLGVMLGFDLDRPGAGLVKICRDNGLLINCTHQTVLRIMPSIAVTRSEINEAVGILDKSFAEFLL